MLEKSSILRTLEQLSSLYNNVAGKKEQRAFFYSKLALLEVCGWIEESMDEIILHVAKKHLKERNNEKYIQTIVKHNAGFDYERNFRKLLIHLIGIINVEHFEQQLDPAKFTQLISTLEALRTRRNNEAHTHIKKGVMRTIDAPSMTKRYFLQVYAGLDNILGVLHSMKF